MKLDRALVKSSRGDLAFYFHDCGKKSIGTILCLHGGPGGDHCGNNNIFMEIIEYAIPMGFNCILFDMFGSGDSDGRQRDFDLSSMKDDYATALTFFNEKFGGKLHVIGESMGATIAALNWFEAVDSYVMLWPAFDLVDTDLHPYLSGQWIEMAKNNGYIIDGDLEMGLSFLEEINTFNFDLCFSLPPVPTLIVHGKLDKSVPFQQSVRAATESSGQVTLCLYPAGDHGLQAKEERAYTHKVVCEWLKNQ